MSLVIPIIQDYSSYLGCVGLALITFWVCFVGIIFLTEVKILYFFGPYVSEEEEDDIVKKNPSYEEYVTILRSVDRTTFAFLIVLAGMLFLGRIHISILIILLFLVFFLAVIYFCDQSLNCFGSFAFIKIQKENSKNKITYLIMSFLLIVLLMSMMLAPNPAASVY